MVRQNNTSIHTKLECLKIYQIHSKLTYLNFKLVSLGTDEYRKNLSHCHP